MTVTDILWEIEGSGQRYAALRCDWKQSQVFTTPQEPYNCKLLHNPFSWNSNSFDAAKSYLYNSVEIPFMFTVQIFSRLICQNVHHLFHCLGFGFSIVNFLDHVLYVKSQLLIQYDPFMARKGVKFHLQKCDSEFYRTIRKPLFPPPGYIFP